MKFEDIEKLLKIPWPDYDIDHKHCFRILFDQRPDGCLGPLIEHFETHPNPSEPDNPIMEIKLNVIVCQWMQYFYQKYGDELGSKLGRRFIYEVIFEPSFIAKHAEN